MANVRHRREALFRIRKIAKSFGILVLGRGVKPRRILRGLPSGYRIVISPEENLSYLVGTAEPHLQKAIRKYVGRGDVVYDIGANVGYVSLSLAKQVGSKGYVAAFEPIPENIAKLRWSIEQNELSHVEVYGVAASDAEGLASIRVTGNFSTASMIWHKNDSSAVELRVQTVRIDRLVDSGVLRGNPQFVKIDVEGAEGLVLKGMERTVSTARPVLFIECSDNGREVTWQMLTKLRYKCESAMTGRRVTEFREYRHADFLWVPQE